MKGVPPVGISAVVEGLVIELDFDLGSRPSSPVKPSSNRTLCQLEMNREKRTKFEQVHSFHIKYFDVFYSNNSYNGYGHLSFSDETILFLENK